MIRVEQITRRGFLAAGAVGAAMVGVGGFGAVS
ncbi:twin-arginine translocation signal domain-containing protein, partial [Eggerthella sinensis]